jgi:hypothetical protein
MPFSIATTFPTHEIKTSNNKRTYIPAVVSSSDVSSFDVSYSNPYAQFA